MTDDDIDVQRHQFTSAPPVSGWFRALIAAAGFVVALLALDGWLGR